MTTRDTQPPTLPDAGESRAYPGQTPREPQKRVLGGWFAPWKRSLGTWGFVLNRVAGIGLVVYLYLHLIVLSTLLRGEDGWNQFVALAKQPAFLTLDVILIAGILGHGLNGLRVALVGSGVLVKWQRPLFIVFVLLMLALLVWGAVLVFTA